MATLQKIRNRAGILIAIIIGMAIFAFVLQDMLTGGNPNMMGSRTDFAEIDGKPVKYEEYVRRLEKLTEYYRLRLGRSSLDEQTMQSIREQTWQNIVRDYTTMDEYEELGIAVSTDELMDMVQGRNPHPLIRSLFSDPQTGVLNRTFLVEFIRTMNEDPSGAQRTIWLYLENQIVEDRAFTKYINLVSQGLYVTDLEVENKYAETNRETDISFIVKRFSDVPDSLILINGKDIQDYYRDHQKEYVQEATRDLEYVVFEVLPSEEDDRMAEEWIDQVREEFETAEDPVAMVNMESDKPYDDINYKDGELPEVINDFMFSSEPGVVYGPYFEDNSYTLARLIEINYLPDSVHARHILLQPDANRDINRIMTLSDSLKKQLERGNVDFETLARLYSMDGTAQTGGDLGWFSEGNMVKPFSDSCFYGETGEIMIVNTQYGVHLVEVLEKSRNVKKVKVAYLSREVEPSSETYQKKYAEAVKFAGEHNKYEKFNAGISEYNLTRRYAGNLTKLQQTITGLESPRPLIRWAFEADLNDVATEIFEFGNKYVIAALTGVREEGIAPLEQVRTEIELEVEKNKKAELIEEEFSENLENSDNIFELAEAMDLIVQEANNITFTSVSIPSAGIEPNVIATSSVLPLDQPSDPVQGNNGVYVIVVNNIRETEESDASSLRLRIASMRQSQANFEAYEALKEASEIEDNRSNFF